MKSRAAWTQYVDGTATNKYGADRTAGYASKLEYSVAQELQLLKRNGEVIDIIEQADFPLYGRNGAKVSVHRVDFLLVHKDGHPEIVEAKGAFTALYKLKLKLFRASYPHMEYTLRTKAA